MPSQYKCCNTKCPLHLDVAASPAFPETLLPLDHLDSLTENEQKVLRHSIKEYNDFIQETGHAIEKISAFITPHAAAQSHGQNDLSVLSTILRSTRSLPNEILARIFVYCTTPSNDHRELWCHIDTTDSLNLSAQPWTLTHVCRRWRKIALESPQLWTRLNLRLHEYRPENRLKHTQTLGTFLARSKSCPLGVSLWSKTSLTRFQQDLLGHALEAVAGRVKSLCLAFPSDAAHEFSAVDALPLLEHAEIAATSPVPDGISSRVHFRPFTLFHKTPKLHTLTANTNSIISGIGIPLDTVAVTLVGKPEALATFAENNQTIFHKPFTILAQKDSSPAHLTSSKVTPLAHFRDLTISDVLGGNLSVVARYLQLYNFPNVERLKLKFLAGSRDGSEDVFPVECASFAVIPKLRVLSIASVDEGGMDFSDNDLKQLTNMLMAAKDITALAIGLSDVDRLLRFFDILDQREPWEPKERILPKLTHLNVTAPRLTWTESNMEALHVMLKARPNLKHVSFPVNPDLGTTSYQPNSLED